MSEPARLGVAVLGIGRMGRRHALNVGLIPHPTMLPTLNIPIRG